MNRFDRTVLAYHGCRPDFAESMIRGELDIDDWTQSQNDYDWLGHGIYFWEYAPDRAANWPKKRPKGGVVGAIIQIGNCLDLTDIRSTKLLAEQFAVVEKAFATDRLDLPANRDGQNNLDCLVINSLADSIEKFSGIEIDTVRCPYLEGPPAFTGSAIRAESHVQLAVRNKACILGVFRPTPNPKPGVFP